MRAFTRKITLLMTLVTLLLGAASCTKKGASGKPSNVDYYTCTMHPSVKSQDPNGKCPICSMDLVPVLKKSAAGEAPHQHDHHEVDLPGTPSRSASGELHASDFSVPVERQQQIGVTYAVV